MSPQEVASAIRFGRHVAKATGSETLANYSHNGIGTKACLNFFSRLAIYSVHPAPADASAGGGAALTSTLLLLDVADKHGDGVCKQALQIVWQGVADQEKLPPAQQEDARRLCAQLSYLPPARRTVEGALHEFGARCHAARGHARGAPRGADLKRPRPRLTRAPPPPCA